MHRVALAFYVFCIKQWSDKKLGETIQCRFKKITVDIKEIIGVFRGGKGIVVAAMLTDKGLIFPGFRIFFGAEKQHVFQKVCKTLSVCRILVVTYIDVQRCGGLLGGCIRYQQNTQLVFQGDVAVFAVIILALDNLERSDWFLIRHRRLFLSSCQTAADLACRTEQQPEMPGITTYAIH